MITADLIGANKPELAVYRALTKLGEVFSFQKPLMGGRNVRGGAIADFLLPEYSLIISVIGWYWHGSLETKARDRMQHIALASYGYRVIYIDEADANENAEHFVKEAIRGIDHSRYAQIL